MLEEIKKTFEDIRDAMIDMGIDVDYCDSPSEYAEKLRNQKSGGESTNSKSLLFIPIFKSSKEKPDTPTGTMSVSAPTSYPKGWSTPNGLETPIWMSYTLVDNTQVYIPWTEPICMSGGSSDDSGEDSGDETPTPSTEVKTYRVCTIYTNRPIGVTPGTPEGGTWDKTSNKLVGYITSVDSQGNTVAWYDSALTVSGQDTWRSYALFASTGEICGEWSDPDNLSNTPSGEKSNEETIYARLTSPDLLSTVVTPESKDVDNYCPAGWSTLPVTITTTYRVGIQCMRFRVNGVWGGWSDPSIYTVWGEKGEDGKSIEYVYYLTDNAEQKSNGWWTCSNTATDPKFQINDKQGFVGYVKGVATWYDDTIDDWVPDGWYDDPQSVGLDTGIYQFVSTRIKSNGVWGNFITPILWNRWANDGKDGNDGKNGLDGNSYENVYCLVDQKYDPDQITVDNTSANKDGAHTTDEYKPNFITGLGSSAKTWESSDEPQSVSSGSPYQYQSIRKKLKGQTEWSDFSEPVLYNNFSYANLAEESVEEVKASAKQVATDAVNNAINDINNVNKTINDIKTQLEYDADTGTYAKLNVYDENTKTLSTVLGNINDLEGKYSAVDQKADGISTTVGEVSTTANSALENSKANYSAIEGVKTDVSTIKQDAQTISQRVTSVETTLNDGQSFLASTAGQTITKELVNNYATKTDFKEINQSLTSLTSEMASMSTIDGHYLVADITIDGTLTSCYATYVTNGDPSDKYVIYMLGSTPYYMQRINDSTTWYTAGTLSSLHTISDLTSTTQPSGAHLLGMQTFDDWSTVTEYETDEAKQSALIEWKNSRASEIASNGVVVVDSIGAVWSKSDQAGISAEKSVQAVNEQTGEIDTLKKLAAVTAYIDKETNEAVCQLQGDKTIIVTKDTDGNEKTSTLSYALASIDASKLQVNADELEFSVGNGKLTMGEFVDALGATYDGTSIALGADHIVFTDGNGKTYASFKDGTSQIIGELTIDAANVKGPLTAATITADNLQLTDENDNVYTSFSTIVSSIVTKSLNITSNTVTFNNTDGEEVGSLTFSNSGKLTLSADDLGISAESLGINTDDLKVTAKNIDFSTISDNTTKDSLISFGTDNFKVKASNIDFEDLESSSTIASFSKKVTSIMSERLAISGTGVTFNDDSGKKVGELNFEDGALKIDANDIDFTVDTFTLQANKISFIDSNNTVYDGFSGAVEQIANTLTVGGLKTKGNSGTTTDGTKTIITDGSCKFIAASDSEDNPQNFIEIGWETGENDNKENMVLKFYSNGTCLYNLGPAGFKKV